MVYNKNDLQTNSAVNINPKSGVFEENRGQVIGYDRANHPEVTYFFKQKNLTIFLLNNGLAYQFEKNSYQRIVNNKKPAIPLKDSIDSLTEVETYRMDMDLVGANPNPDIIAEDKSEDYINYYNHNALDVHSYQKIIYKNIYPGIDWILYSSRNAAGQEGVKYDFIIHPYADASQIKMQYKYTEQIILDEQGNIILRNRMGDIVDKAPIAVLENRTIPLQFELKNNLVQFKIQPYDHSKKLIIDPKIEWSSYYGGTLLDGANSTSIDSLNNVYLCGHTRSQTMIAYGGYQNSISNNITYSAMIVKFASSGSRLWATYYNGQNSNMAQGSTTYATHCICDRNNNLYFSGATIDNVNFSTMNSHKGNYDGYVVKLNAAGSRLWSKYIGGSIFDQIYQTAIDNHNNIIVAGTTQSNNVAMNGYSHQSTSTASESGLVLKLDSNGSQIWSTYYGGSEGASINSCAVDSSNNIYIAGATKSVYNISYNGFQDTISVGGAQDVFLVKFNENGVRQWGTYIGGSGGEISPIISINKFQQLYVSFSTGSTTNIAHNGFQNTYGGYIDVALFRFNSYGNRIWSTYFGGSNSDYALGLLVSGSHIYLSVETKSAGMDYKGIKNYNNGNDGIIAKFDTACNRIWSTYLGFETWGVAYTGNSFMAGNLTNGVFISGQTQSSTGVAYNGFQNTYQGGGDAFLIKLVCNRDTTLYRSICIGDSFYFNNSFLKSTGIYLDTLETWDFCDSFITLNLAVNRRDTTYLYDTICRGSSKFFHGSYRTSSGIYRDTLTNAVGCDSTIVYTLTVKDTSAYSYTAKRCAGDSMYFGGQWLRSTGIYRDTLQNQQGCDSFIALSLEVGTIYRDTTWKTICFNNSVLFKGILLNQSGTYHDTLKTSFGCDSIVTLNLTVKPTSAKAITASICAGQRFDLGSKSYTSSGIYRDTIPNAMGCDSFLSLTLTVKSTSTSNLASTICSSDSFYFKQTYLRISGTYTDTLQNASGCDSAVNLSLTVRPSRKISIAASGVLLIATQGFAKYTWLRNQNIVAGETKYFLAPKQSGTYTALGIDEYLCQHPSNAIDYIYSSILNADAPEFTIYPNPASDFLYVRSSNLHEKNYKIFIYSVDGKLVSMQKLKNQNAVDAIDIALLERGMYVFEIRNNTSIFRRKFVKD
jgi:hypothetical protein